MGVRFADRRSSAPTGCGDGVEVGRAKTVWLTGLPCAGKSTVAALVKARLTEQGRLVGLLDGDEIRAGLCSDLGFGTRDRTENVSRAAEVAKLFNDAGAYVIVALISPLISDRHLAKSIVGVDRFLEVFLSASREVCETRDIKGMYARARRGEIASFTGVDAPYEEPPAPDCVLDTAAVSPDTSAERVLALLAEDHRHSIGSLSTARIARNSAFGNPGN